MMSKNRLMKVCCGLLICLSVGVCGVLLGDDVHAERDITKIQLSIELKGVLQGVYRCYTGGYVRNDWPASEYKGIRSLMTDNSNENKTYVPLVTGVNKGILTTNPGNYNI